MYDPVAAPRLDIDCDRAKIEASLAAPAASYGGEDFYKTLPQKAAALMYSFAKGHACENGNKRLAAVMTQLFLEKNDFFFWATQRELERKMLEVSKSDAKDCDIVRADAAEWIEAHIIPLMEATLRIQRGELPPEGRDDET